ncbi:MAG TPA: class IV adenylate cyclase [Burkholderiaceae bacterium]|nr:class IV adenylate cyclase [Burkholderiaceae bacterium]
MARNVEIKARIDSIESVLPRARSLADADAKRIVQDDTFFRVARGRLKLRELGDGSAELIHYQRPDSTAAKLSDYVRWPVAEASGLREALVRALGTLGRVRKQRLLLMVGATRIHLDRVAGLGDFVELEVVLRDGQSEAEGAAIAERLMCELGLAAAPRVAGAYVDLPATA